MTRRDMLLAGVMALIWGVNFVAIDEGMGSVPPLLFAAIRFTFVVVPLIFVVPRPAAPFATVAAIGALMSLGQFGFLYVSMHAGMPSGMAALVLQSQVVFTILIAAVALRERIGLAQGLGVLLGAAGLVVVALGRGGGVPVGALLLCLGGGLSWGIGNVVARAAKVPGGLSLTVWSATVVPVPLALLDLVVDGPHAMGAGLASMGWRGIGSTAYTVIASTLVAYAIFNSLLARHPSSRVVPWVLLVPVVALLTAWAVQGERPNAAEVAGAVLLVGGVLVAQRSWSRQARPREEQARPPLQTQAGLPDSV